MADTLIDKLRAKLDETEDVARVACHGGEGRWSRSSDSYIDDETGKAVVNGEFALSDAQAEHIIRHDPASVLRRVAADRKILHMLRVNGDGDLSVELPGETLCDDWCVRAVGEYLLKTLAERYDIEVPAVAQ